MMRNELDVLLDKVDDPALRADLRAQIERIQAKRNFGLVFESHLPERVRLPEHPIRRGVKVALRDDPASPTFEVLEVAKDLVSMRRVRNPDGTVLSPEDAAAESVDETATQDSLIVIADFGEPVFPGLRHLGSVERGSDKPAHVVIRGENHHVLEALQFSHAGNVDCIYIDPPYNTGARDWKYNNDYVDETDAWRHSKWLSMMERRLRLAKQLLNPEDSVLIVTIDEHEVHHLRMLLEQVFPEAYIQMVTIVVNPKGVAQGRFARVEEYAIYCFLGDAAVGATDDDFMSDNSTQRNTRFWKGLLRAGTNALPSDGLNMGYPIAVDPERVRVVGTGRTLRERVEAGEVERDKVNDWLPDAAETVDGFPVVWPVRRDGALGVWQAKPETLHRLNEQGYLRVVFKDAQWAVSYVAAGTQAKIDNGEIEVVRRDGGDGPVILERKSDKTRAKTVWKRADHDSGWHGAVLLRELLGERRFDFPKSLYATRDSLLPVVGDKPDAVILDFFAGSGTTFHAVALLNQADGGSRQAILVTNNEVSEGDAKRLRAEGFLPGSPEWESEGIFSSVTRPRCEAAITGHRPDGRPVEGEYADGTARAEGLDENVGFLELTYLDAEEVELDLAFGAIAPLLWLRAGGRGPVLDECLDAAGRRKPYAWTEQYGVLFNPDRWRTFVEKLPTTATTAFVVTDSQSTFAGIASELPGSLDVVRLYENYLTTFMINQGYS